MEILQNCWYMLGWNTDLPPTKVISRTVADLPIAAWRDSTGSAAAILDRCPHRFVPLSMGKCTENGSIQCGYHGLEFNRNGQCTHNPHGDGRIPRAAHVRSFPTVERDGIIWVWLGQAKSEESLIPDFSVLKPSISYSARRHMHVKANYMLETDNILDLSHIEYLHPGTLGSDSVKHSRHEVTQVGSTVYSRRFIQAERLAPFLQQTFGIPGDTLADRWLDVRWDPPASMLLTVTIAPSGQPREAGRTIHIPHIFTPETQATTHYWYASCFVKADHTHGESQAERHVEGLTIPFANEDLPMLEAQQKNIGRQNFWSLQPVLLSTDAAAVRARRVLDTLIQTEKENSHEQAN